jgi:predicted  nucleic acid-binding Zn-ribbon protein
MSNSSIDQIVAELEAIRDAVQARRLDANDADERQRLGAEYRKINARIVKLQATAFAAGTDALGSQLASIRNAGIEIKKATKRIDAMNDVLHGVAGVLGVVDSILRIAGRATLA